MKRFQLFAKILTVAGAAAAVVFFFFPFVQITFNGDIVTLTGSQMWFGGSHQVAGSAVKNAVSAYFIFTFFVTVIGAVIAGFAFKTKGASIAAPAFTLLSVIMFITFVSSPIRSHVDPRPFVDAAGASVMKFDLFFYLCFYTLIAATVIGAATIFVNDIVAVRASNGAKKPMLKRFVRWLRDYKSELKKIVWPTKHDVIRDTIIVLAMCLVVGGIVWLLDGGLTTLLDKFLKVKSGGV